MLCDYNTDDNYIFFKDIFAMENSGGRRDMRHRRACSSQAYSGLLYQEEAIYKLPFKSTDSMDDMERFKGTISTLWAGLIVFILLICLALVHYNCEHRLPNPLTINDVVPGQDLFITERAKSDSIGLALIGEKVVGSYRNQVLAIEYLLHHLQQIKARATNDKTIEIDVQTCSGGYYISQKRGLTNMYVNMVNVISRLSDGDQSSNALLVNCHFDSHPSSPGASDNGLNCAVMLEVLRVLSQSNATLMHDVIFLFNGAEENPLQGSHGFITNHTWAKDVRAFLNFDSCGHGGREILFQTDLNSPWLTTYYASTVPHPYGSSCVTDLFESGLIPSDTDFRIFRDFGKIPGLDIAHHVGGYVYHTLYDNFSIIPDGTYQHTGDNMLALTKAIANSKELVDTTNRNNGGSMVYYDLFGLFVVYYSTRVGTLLYVGMILLSLYAPVKVIVRSAYPWQNAITYFITLIVQVVGIVAGVCLAVLSALMLDWSGNAMSWFTRNWLVLGLFVAPALIPLLVINWILTAKPVEQSRLGLGQRVQLNCETVTIFWAIILLFMMYYGLRSAYIIAMIGFPAIANIIINLLHLQRRVKLWLPLYMGVGLVIPTLYSMQLGSMLLSLIPIMGRSGSQIIPDVYIAIVFSGLTILFGSFWTPILAIVRRPRAVIMSFVIVTILTLLAVLLTPLGFPYGADPLNPTPQRFWLIHTERSVHDINGNVIYNDSGYWLQNLDRNSPHTMLNTVSELRNGQFVKDNCLDVIYCGMPLWRTRDMLMLNKSIWVPAEAPIVQNYQPSSLVAAWNTTSTESRRLFLNISGPTHLNLFIAPRTGVTLNGWSLFDEVHTSITWNDRLLYFVLYSYGSMPDYPWQVWLDLTVPINVTSAIDIALNAHYLHEIHPLYQSILNELPLWMAPLHWTATHKSFIF